MNRRKNIGIKLAAGILLADYERMLIEQQGACAVCLVPATEFSRRLVVDHCHKTNTVRGLLCTRCNVALGYIKDNTTILKRLIDYLSIYQQ